MPTTLTWTDRLRIERVLWILDTHVQSLPGRSRRTIRREMRANLRASAAEVGVGAAIRGLGGLRHLAKGYLDAEYDGRPRPRLLKAMFWVLTVEVLILWSAFLGHTAFVDGVESANPSPHGTFTWHTLQTLGIGGDVSYAGGHADAFGLWFNQWTVLYLAVAFLVGGRFWRLVPRWWRRRGTSGTTPAGT